MTPRERVICALEHRDSDVVPWSVDLTMEERTRLVKHTGNTDIEESFGNHIISMEFGSMDPFAEKTCSFIVAPTHAVPPDVPPENVLAMIEVFNNQSVFIKRG